MSILSWYANKLSTHPRVTKSVTAATIGAAGDQVQQAFERLDDPAQRNDLARTTRMAAFGGLFVGPFLHWWYGRLEALFPANVPLRTVKKVALDQATAAPLTTLGFFAIMGLISGHPPDRIAARIQDRFVDTMLVNYAVWPIAIAVNFAVVPVRYQVLWTNTVGLAYNTFLSQQQHAHQKPQAAGEE
ncbi:unnamed protein product (mitochondrion) [Plasmodiophora brassicae]|uniref:Uncharacterized protein n=1 Tax=Plasmodiophora brassicae TaxID=37360 RepID=A0A0G4IR38_PLABS|nr:hypothetical protein PBRA_005962 [Plasmodiophora brassicae]SPQ98068.1 unnamed protein product [Plasmodiophora brassicae]